jgi:hypothetical protein
MDCYSCAYHYYDRLFAANRYCYYCSQRVLKRPISKTIGVNSFRRVSVWCFYNECLYFFQIKTNNSPKINVFILANVSNGLERIDLAFEYFLKQGSCKNLKTFSMRGMPRPENYKHYFETNISSPVFASEVKRFYLSFPDSFLPSSIFALASFL